MQALPEAKAADDDYEVESMGTEQHEEPGEPDTPPATPDKPHCSACNAEIASNVAKFSQEKYGKDLCYTCQQTEKKKQKEAGK